MTGRQAYVKATVDVQKGGKMSDLIDRQILKADLLCGDNAEHDYCFPCKEILERIDNQPAVETHDKRTETHACDLIDRQAAIDEVARWEGYLDEDMIYCIQRGLKSVPSAQPDLSSYSDKLWRNAYERGKAEAQAEIVRCKDCKWKQGAECVRFAEIRVFPDDFCSRAERREDG